MKTYIKPEVTETSITSNNHLLQLSGQTPGQEYDSNDVDYAKDNTLTSTSLWDGGEEE